ncbi:MAG: hypothetical protein WB580_22410 [Candidatus Binataceae bacterium]
MNDDSRRRNKILAFSAGSLDDAIGALCVSLGIIEWHHRAISDAAA